MFDGIIVAWQAFRDPRLVSEAKGMRSVLSNLYRNGETGLINAKPLLDGSLYPEIQIIRFDDLRRLRGF